MIYPINHDQQVLQQPARPATSADRQLAEALVATLTAHQDHCIGMAANMIGFPVSI
ncbi:peptide deformylase, partial [Limosilactobacillus fermentum]|nr:peptide deformylase [Limosilactobacillus fermentum]